GTHHHAAGGAGEQAGAFDRRLAAKRARHHLPCSSRRIAARSSRTVRASRREIAMFSVSSRAFIAGAPSQVSPAGTLFITPERGPTFAPAPMVRLSATATPPASTAPSPIVTEPLNPDCPQITTLRP